MAIKMGIIGFGYIGKWHLNNAPKAENVSVVAAYDINPERVKAAEDVLAVGDAVTAKIINTEKGKISLSIKALLVPEEVVVVEKEPVFNYKEEGKASTNLGDLLKGLKF